MTSLICLAGMLTMGSIPARQVFVLSVPTAGQPGHGRTPDPEHYFIKDLVVRLQAGQVNDDGSPLNRCFLANKSARRCHSMARTAYHLWPDIPLFLAKQRATADRSHDLPWLG